jgi:hypothetical protein
MWRRYQLEVAVERGEIPPGFEPEDFEAAGLPVPPRKARPSADPSDSAPPDPQPLVPAQAGIQADVGSVPNGGTGSPLPRGRTEDGIASKPPANPFACDAPDDK